MFSGKHEKLKCAMCFICPQNTKCGNDFRDMKLQCTCYFTKTLCHWEWGMIAHGEWF